MGAKPLKVPHIGQVTAGDLNTQSSALLKGASNRVKIDTGQTQQDELQKYVSLFQTNHNTTSNYGLSDATTAAAADAAAADAAAPKRPIPNALQSIQATVSLKRKTPTAKHAENDTD